MIKKFFIVLLVTVLFIIMMASFYNIIVWVIDNKKTNDLIVDIKENVYSEEENKDNSVKSKIDFNKLFEINEDTVGWIEIENTNVNYPIVKHKNNSYYLSHSFDNSYNDAGWVFLDYRNSLNDLYQNNLIYAHGRIDGSMFGSLKNLFNEEYFNSKNHEVYIYTPIYDYVFEVFSFYKIETTNDYTRVNFDSDEDYLDFIKMLKDRSVNDFKVDVLADDKIITLSTCFNNREKLVMHAKLKKDKK